MAPVSGGNNIVIFNDTNGTLILSFKLSKMAMDEFSVNIEEQAIRFIGVADYVSQAVMEGNPNYIVESEQTTADYMVKLNKKISSATVDNIIYNIGESFLISSSTMGSDTTTTAIITFESAIKVNSTMLETTLHTAGKYCSKNIKVIVSDDNLTTENIKKDVTILGVTGTYEGQSYPEYSFSNDGLTISGDNSLFVADGEHNIPLSDAYTVQLDFSWNSGTRAFNIYEQNTDSTDDSDRTLLWSNPSYDASGSASVELKVTKPFLYIAPPTFGNRSYTPSGGVSEVNVIIFKVTGDGGLTVNASCLTGDTLVTMSDYSTKRLDEIRLGDKVLSFDFDSKELIAREVIYTDKDENKSHTEYDKWTFDDGTVIKTVHRHEFYNAEAKRMKYMDEWKMGEHTYKIDGSNPKLIAHERVKETVNHYKITLEGSTNYFANGLLNGDRYCPTNIIPEVK